MGVTLVTDDFFSGVDQFDALIGGQRAKSPTFYRDARSLTLVLPANLMALRRIMPDPCYVPAQVLPGVGAVNLTALEYQDTDIGPYREFSIGVALNSTRFLQVPCYNIMRQALQRAFDVYIHHLPVTSEIALRGGVDYYNYPKFMADIDFDDDDDRVQCELSVDGDLICRVRGRKIDAPRQHVLKNFCHLYQSKQPQSAEFKINARQYGVAAGRGNAELVVGQAHPVGRELSSLLLSTTPLIYVYMPSMQAILYGPEHLSLTSIGRFLEQGFGISLDQLSALMERERSGGAPAKKAAKKAASKKAAAAKPAAKKSAVQAAIDEAVGTIPEE
jgi:hypothetical protein